MLELTLKKDLSPIVDTLVGTYTETSSTHHLDTCPLPNYGKVLMILDNLRELLYPGYYGRERLNLSNVKYLAGSLVDQLHDLLSNQIYRALCHGRKTPDRNSTDSATRQLTIANATCTPEFRAKNEQDGNELAFTFMQMLPELRRTLALDVEAAFAGDPACRSHAEVVFCYPGFEAITVYRLSHALHKLGVPLIPRMMSEYVHSRTGIDIHPGATIGRYFFIDHGTGVVVGETCVIGDWVKLYQGVTLGALSFPRDSHGELICNTKRHPTIEDNVVIY
ncbi:MAG: serine O-acetyltransferase, partial [Thermoguttaceae bacterium]